MTIRSITRLTALVGMLLLWAACLGPGAGPAAADTPPVSSRTPESIDFGSQPAGTTSSPRTITVTAVSDGFGLECDPTQRPPCWEVEVPTDISNLTIGGTDAAAFKVSGQSCTGRNLWQGQTCSIDVTFSPAVGNVSYSATLTINSNSSWSAGNQVQLSGNADCSQNVNGTKIAYSSGAWDPTDFEIYTIDDTGGASCQLTNNTTPDGAPSLSSDGQKIAYEGFDGQDFEIYTIDATGGTPFQVTNNTTDDGNPAYSPDGKKIAYEGFDGQDREIYTIDATGGTPFQVTNNTTLDHAPTYSPDGKKIAYVCADWQSFDWEICTIDATGGPPFNVTNNTTLDHTPTYSPDGQKIAYMGRVGIPFSEIYTIDASGGTPFQVTNNTTPDDTPSFSPDGKKIAYGGGERSADDEIFTIDASGGTPFNVTNNTRYDFSPSYPVASFSTKPPGNELPSVDAGGPYEVNEGDTVNVSATGTDPEGGPLTYAWDLDEDGEVDDASTQSASFPTDDGPSDSRTVKVQVTDDKGAKATDTAGVTVNNVEPTIQSISASTSQTLTGKSVSFDASTTDPSTADTNAGFTYAWLVDGVANSFTGNPLNQSFSDCGEHSVSAAATDKDGGVSASVTSDVVSAYDAHFRPPLDEGVYNMVQKGRVVPVKISIGCDDQNLTDLSPAIQILKGDKSDGTETSSDAIETLSSSAADTTGIMRAVDDGYIYNLQVPSNAVAGDLYTIRVRPFGDSNTSASMYVVLKIRK